MSCRAIASFLLCLFASTTAVAADAPSIYHEVYPCLEASLTSTCVVGAVPRGAPITLITKDQAISAKRIREVHDYGNFTGTVLKHDKGLSKSGEMLAILAPISTVSVLKQELRDDPNDAELVRKVGDYVEKINREHERVKDASWVNPHSEIRIVGLTPTAKVVQVTVTADMEAPSPTTDQMEVMCSRCGGGKLTFLARDDDLFDLFNTKQRFVCSDLVSAFRLSGRLHLFATTSGCTEGGYDLTVQGVSGPAPRPVFTSSFFSH